MKIESDIRKLYEDDELSLREIARRLSSNRQTVSNTLDQLGVRKRASGWSRSHEGNPNVGWPNARKKYNDQSTTGGNPT